MNFDFQNFLFDAIDSVLTKEIPEETFAQAVQAQVGLKAGLNWEEIDGFSPEFA